jgi:uncharacterized glyoxalase superfamily protein PhnB
VTQEITPYLLYEDADAAARFACAAFGFREEMRLGDEESGLHVELRLGDAAIYLGSPAPGERFRNPDAVGRTSLVYVQVVDVDAHCERARAAGAGIVEEPADQPYGERRYGCRDPQGHEWFFAQPL